MIYPFFPGPPYSHLKDLTLYGTTHNALPQLLPELPTDIVSYDYLQKLQAKQV